MFFLFTSCSGVEFVYKENTNLGNPIYNKTEYKNHLDKNSRRLINLGELKYPFALVKSESNNNCLKNFHGKLSVEPCVESNGQMWQPLMKERKCQ